MFKKPVIGAAAIHIRVMVVKRWVVTKEVKVSMLSESARSESPAVKFAQV
ncbi:MAG TPA: hypothetical protein VM656_12495 [Pyrinomonadaceae bacterium]|nr:hypothetical protein [Pyrinomonadaceae bacterium]